MRFVYLAYPIDQVPMMASQVSLFEQVTLAKQMLTEYGVDVVFDPGDAFQVRMGATPGREIAHINMLALGKATGVLAFLPRGMATIGVPQEVDRAARAGVPVAVISNANSWSLVAPHILQFNEDRWADAVRWLADQPGRREESNPPLYVKVAEGGKAPTKAYPDDAGFDLYANEDVTIKAQQFLDVDLGVAVRLPRWGYGRLIGRSSTFRRKGLLVLEGVIDAGYTGPLYVGCYNPGPGEVVVERGERIAQLIVQQNSSQYMEVNQTDDLGWTQRGSNGFGSSGT